MKVFAKIFTALTVMLSLFSGTAVADSYDVFVPIAKYLGNGDAERLSAWFDDNLEITIMSTTNDSSKNQAKQILKAFFDNHTPRSNSSLMTNSGVSPENFASLRYVAVISA